MLIISILLLIFAIIVLYAKLKGNDVKIPLMILIILLIIDAISSIFFGF